MTDSDIARIAAFLDSIGIAVTCESIPDDGFLPGIVIRDGGLIYDPDRLTWSGDLLHEAGHIAVTEADRRATLSTVKDDQGEEIAAIAWSYAAAMACGVDPAAVFHDGGYDHDRGGGGNWLVEAFAGAGRTGPGVPLLAWYGMTRDPAGVAGDGPAFPAMARWLR